MEKEFVIQIGKQYVKRRYQGNSRDYLGFGFTADVSEAKRFYENEPVEVVKNAQLNRRKSTRVVSNDGLEYANFVAEQLGGQVYEVETTVNLVKV